MAFFLVDGIVSSWREDVKNHILTDFCRSACFACQLTGLCHPAAFYKVWIHLYIELHCRQFNIASQYVAGIDLHFSGLHWCIVFFVSFWLALYGWVPGLSCPSSQLYIWGSCYPRVTHTIIHHIRYPTQNYRFLENLFYEIRLWNIWDLVKPTNQPKTTRGFSKSYLYLISNDRLTLQGEERKKNCETPAPT